MRTQDRTDRRSCQLPGVGGAGRRHGRAPTRWPKALTGEPTASCRARRWSTPYRRRPAPTASTTTATAWSTCRTPTAASPPARERGASKPRAQPTTGPAAAEGRPRSRPAASSTAPRSTATTHPAKARGGVAHNDNLGESAVAAAANGGVQAPSATGGGDQPPAEGGDGGAQFSAGGAPTPRQPDDDDRALRPGPDRRPQLRHRLLRDPALPAADLPGLRHRIRDPLGGAGLDQQNRDRLRHQPQRLQRRRRRLDAVPALELGNLRRSMPTATGARTPTTRSTRSAPRPIT